MSRRTFIAILIGFVGLLAVGALIIVAVLVGAVIGGRGGSKTPVDGGVTETTPGKGEQASTSTVTVRVSGDAGIQYQGTIGTFQTGQRSIEGTVGQTPDDYELPLDISEENADSVTASVGKRPEEVGGGFRRGVLRVQLLVGGQVVKEQETSTEAGTVTVTYSPGLEGR